MTPQLRSGKAFSPWALGHPTFDLNLANLIEERTPISRDDEQDELEVLSQDYSLLPVVHNDGVDDLSALRMQLPGQLLPSPPSPVPTDLLLPYIDANDEDVGSALGNDASEKQEATPDPGWPDEETCRSRFMGATPHC